MNADVRHFILATAGHVDHGKSALVRALTGIDPDRLPEEKARGITIDLGFAALHLSDPSGVAFQVSIIDVPGHEDFVKNMVAGVGSVDLALLVVAADDGWMPQTEEHLQILTYLGVTRGVVALTKCDLLDGKTSCVPFSGTEKSCVPFFEDRDDLQAMICTVREHLRGTPLAEAPIVPTSVVTARGIDELGSALLSVLHDAPPPRDIGKPRLPIDRVFTLKGAGTIVTGTLTAGRLSKGQAVAIQPHGSSARIRSIQSHNAAVETAVPGSRVALNLPDVKPESIERGDVVTLPELGEPTSTIYARIDCSPRAAERAIRDGTMIHLHHGSGAFAGRIHLIGTKALERGQQCVARLRLESPIFAFVGDRFVIRDWSEQHTLAGGIVLDLRSAGRHAAGAHARLLAARAKSPLDAKVLISSEIITRHWLHRHDAALVQSHFDSCEIEQAIAALASEAQVMICGEIIADAAWWNHLRSGATDTIDAHHRAHPEQAGLPLTQLEQSIRREVVDSRVYHVLLAELCRDGFRQQGATIRRLSHRPALPSRLATSGQQLRQILSQHPFDPPSRSELAPNDLAEQALRFLILNGEAIELSRDVVLSADAYARAGATIRDHLHASGPATVSQIKALLGSTRRVMVPLLERLDRDGITRRQGDHRVAS